MMSVTPTFSRNFVPKKPLFLDGPKNWVVYLSRVGLGQAVPLKGLSHEIFGPVFWAVWMYPGLNVNRLWFLDFNNALLILDNYFKF